MAELKGFWSYVHADDKAENGRVSYLAQDVQAQFEMLTGDEIDLFLDKDNIDWGDDWRNKIDESLSSVAFFIPILTPRYFMSSECRRELQFFAQRAKKLGIEELVLPLLYVDVPSLHEEAPPDDLVALVKTFQWEDWHELRFSDIESGEYRRGVARLAQRLVEANRKAEEANFTEAALESEPSIEDAYDSPGLLDRLAETEETFPLWQETVEAIVEEIELIGQIMQEAAVDLEKSDTQGKGFAGRLVTARKVSQSLHEPTERIWSLGNEFASQLHRIDPGVRAIIEQAPSEIQESPESLSGFCAFFHSIRQLSASAREGLEQAQGMIDATSSLEAMSRNLRDPARRLRQGLTMMVEAREVTDEWVEIIEGTDIDCSEQTLFDDQSRHRPAEHPQDERQAERAMAVVRELQGKVRTGGRKFTREEMNER